MDGVSGLVMRASSRISDVKHLQDRQCFTEFAEADGAQRFSGAGVDFESKATLKRKHGAKHWGSHQTGVAINVKG